jgi:hypothetical protein
MKQEKSTGRKYNRMFLLSLIFFASLTWAQATNIKTFACTEPDLVNAVQTTATGWKSAVLQ